MPVRHAVDPLTVVKVEIWPVDVPTTDPFVIAQGQLTAAENLFVRLTLRGGAQGFGEIAPFPDLTGEDRPRSARVAQQLAVGLIGQSATHYRKLSGAMAEQAPANPAARCGLETALLDALCRAAALPLWALWGGAEVRPHVTDVTIPITDAARSVAMAREWFARGFRLLKTKVGLDVVEDVRRLAAISAALPGIAFVADANQGFSRADAERFAREAARAGCDVRIFEQPVAKDDLESLAALRRALTIPIAADESVGSLADARAVARLDAVDFINLKITKSGLLETLAIAHFARGAGIRLMIGGMLETRIAMGCSFAIVLGLGGIEALDLDTPLLMASDPVTGGYRYAGAALQPWFGSGLDLTAPPPRDVVAIE